MDNLWKDLLKYNWNSSKNLLKPAVQNLQEGMLRYLWTIIGIENLQEGMLGYLWTIIGIEKHAKVLKYAYGQTDWPTDK